VQLNKREKSEIKSKSTEIKSDTNILKNMSHSITQRPETYIKDMYCFLTFMTNRKSKLKKIHTFFENLPVSEEIIQDEANTNQIHNRLLDKSNLFFPEFYKDEVYDTSFISSYLAPQFKSQDQKKELKRK
jgi:hypothetical protein